MLRNFRKISSIFFLQLNINDTKTVNSKQKAWKTVSNIPGIDKIQREIKKNSCRFTIKIRNYNFFADLFTVISLLINQFFYETGSIVMVKSKYNVYEIIKLFCQVSDIVVV